jgi:hypothetical protein
MLHRSLPLILLLLLPTAAVAENFGKTMDLAMRQYREGAYGAAAATLHEAALLARQKKASTLAAFLPSPPTGWSVQEGAEPAKTVRPAVGVTVERSYAFKAKTISVAIVTDSPLLNIIGVNFQHAAYARMRGQHAGGLKGVRSLVRYQAGRRAGEADVLLNKRVLVVVRGDQVDEEDLLTFARRIDYDGLKSTP